MYPLVDPGGRRVKPTDMTTDAEHPILRFASRYGDPSRDYLNAYIAIARLGMLRDDLQKTSRLLNVDQPDEERWHPWFGAEVISYYSVGFVTCLEWHARSRLVDLLSFDPAALRLEDVRGTISDKLIVKMVAQEATVAQLVGASVRVTSFARYLSIMDRVLSALGAPWSVSDWLTGQGKGANTCWINTAQLAELTRLFDFRHQLVHELGVETMGHPNIREAWSPDEAARTGGVVASVMFGVEAAFTHIAPPLFPNLLDADRWPVSSTRRLSEEFESLDALVDCKMTAGEFDTDRTIARWRKSREAFRTYLEAEQDLIDTADMLHWRYFDARTPLRSRLLGYRVGFLNELLSYLNDEEEGDCGRPK